MINKILMISGDYPFLFDNYFANFSYYPFAWNNLLSNGLGLNGSFTLGLESIVVLIYKPLVLELNLSWYLIEKLVFLIPFFIISFGSAYILSKKYFSYKALYLVSALIYSTNTYALMIVGGGQFGVAMAYALAPAALLLLINPINEKGALRLSNKLICAILLLGLQIMIDSRLALITLIAAFFFYLVNIFVREISWKKLLDFALVTAGALVLNAFWIVPFVFARDLNLSSAYTSGDIASFFSFAKLDNAIGLIHPNYPDNVFGKIGFLRFEYLFIPIIAFSGLIFVNKMKKNQSVGFISFVLIALIGSFLVKGVNYPLGEVYGFVLNNVPFATIYRDPMKFYLLIALAFSILIPWSIKLLSEFIQIKYKKNVLYVLLFIFVVVWLVSIRHLFILGEGGVFKPTKVDDEYFLFAEKFDDTDKFSRTFSVPSKQRFLYNSQLNPAMNASEYFDEFDHDDLIKILGNEGFVDELRDLSVEYVVLPYDQESTIFLEDRRYNQELFDKYYSVLSERDDLIEEIEFKKLKIFRIEEPRELFWNDDEINIIYRKFSPVEYEVNVSNASGEGSFVFNQSYSPNWILKSENGNEIKPTIHADRFNKYFVSESGKYTIYYKSQQLVNIGILISLIGLGALIILILINLGKRKKKMIKYEYKSAS